MAEKSAEIGTIQGVESFAEGEMELYQRRLTEDLGVPPLTLLVVGKDPETGEQLAAPGIYRLVYEGISETERRRSERRLAERLGATASINLWYDEGEQRIVMVVQHHKGTIAVCKSVKEEAGAVSFGQLTDLAPPEPSPRATRENS